ncbi:unnamed protein product [Vitrella brassicaformis CCMP3155]|uniref:Uncharacterized protein n=1 Tax=Vitrella brassicaformis (strain CCMP3155) TaxID=1169540 RepID=A0A0G4EUR3_VITBC|nr:unnamed protein product [Vitrella brassicaformis CCMP3155]|eukprot:CEM02335.1 unnamed protein product [Vitrella brassicaformis CCMP3155]
MDVAEEAHRGVIPTFIAQCVKEYSTTPSFTCVTRLREKRTAVPGHEETGRATLNQHPWSRSPRYEPGLVESTLRAPTKDEKPILRVHSYLEHLHGELDRQNIALQQSLLHAQNLRNGERGKRRSPSTFLGSGRADCSLYQEQAEDGLRRAIRKQPPEERDAGRHVRGSSRLNGGMTHVCKAKTP